MNQAKTTYRSDYSYDWEHSDIIPENEEFCSSENIDDCLKYISQEFRALGYPSIYVNSNPCPYAVNCDIVKYLNATFELLRHYSEHIQIKEDLQDRNHRLSTDLNALNKKNAQLKKSLEESEKKYSITLERERQLKERNDNLTQLLKTERDELKRLASQGQQQKIAHQHEIRKYESSLNQMKAKLNQLLKEKIPTKKIASLNSSHALQRNVGQRGKWKTGAVAKSSLEEMYSSVISSYENRYKDMLKEADEYRQCLHFIKSQLLEMIAAVEENGILVNCHSISDTFIFNAIKNDGQNDLGLEEKFKFLLSKVKDYVLRKYVKTAEDSNEVLKSKIPHYEKVIKEHESSDQNAVSDISHNVRNVSLELKEEKEQHEIEKEKLIEEKMSLCKIADSIAKEKADVEAKKLDLMRILIQQKNSESRWHQGLKNVPSVSVITTRNGLTMTPNATQLKLCLSAPNQFESGVYKSGEKDMLKELHSHSEPILHSEKSVNHPGTCLIKAELNFTNSDLPSWAASNSGEQSIEINELRLENTELQTESGKKHLIICSVSNDDLEVINESSSEEQSYLRLKAAAEDIEQRRNILSPV